MSHRTYRTRIQTPPAPALSAYAAVFTGVMRTLHVRMEKETRTLRTRYLAERESAASDEAREAVPKPKAVKAGDFKNDMLREFGLTGRQFNAIAVSLEGKRKSTIECRNLNLETVGEQILRLDRQITTLKRELVEGRFHRASATLKPLTLKQRKKARFTLHQKQRSLHGKELRRARMLDEIERGAVSLCFGSRKVFNAQFDRELEATRGSKKKPLSDAAKKTAREAVHKQWLAEWRIARSGQFMVLGSKGETGGCQGCVATLAEDGSISLQLRLPDALRAAHGTYVELHGLRFAYGHVEVVEALKSNAARKTVEKQVRLEAKASGRKFSEKDVPGGAALTWRFVQDEKGWEVMVSLDARERPQVSVSAAGRVAVDINAGFLAVAETDYYGNCIKTFSVPCRTQGLGSAQAADAIGIAVKTVMQYAIKVRKPLVLEKLDFRRKKRSLQDQHPAYARMLSSFAYGHIKKLFEARAFDAGIEVFFVDPAYTSVIGRVNHSVPLGITTHEAAAIAIARRSQGARARAPRPDTELRVPVKGNVTAWTSPDWMKPQHRAYPWRCIARSLPRLFERESARKSPAASVSAPARRRTATGAGARGQPPVQA